MKLTLKQRRIFLGGALLLTLAAVFYVGSQDDENVVLKRNVAVRHVPSTRTVAASGVQLQEVKKRDMPSDVRDMFEPKSWYVPPPLPPPGPPPKPVPPPMPFVYQGKMIESDGKILVFLSKQGSIYSVSKGEILDGIYSVDEVNFAIMKLTYLPLHEQQTLSIGESH